MRSSPSIAATLLLSCATSIAGCQLIYTADREELTAYEAGVDGSMSLGPEAGARDAGGDAGRDAGRDACAAREIACGDGRDDDCDGAEDCEDVECQSALECCSIGAELVPHTVWPTSLPPPSWTLLPSGAPSAITASNDRITSFGEDGVRRAIERTSCLPLARGLHLEVVLRRKAFGCDGGACGGVARAVLTVARDLSGGAALPDDLAIELDGAGNLRLTQAGATLAETSQTVVDAGRGVRVSLEVSPGLDSRDRPVLLVSASAIDADIGGGDAGAPLSLASTLPFLLQSDLILDRGLCQSGPGLFLAIEGVGSALEVGEISASALRCANPSVFGCESSGGNVVLDRTSLGFDARWSEGGLSSPGLAGYIRGGARWMLVAETTDRDLDDERFTRVNFAIGRAQSETVAFDGVWDPSGTGSAAFLGETPPHCEGGDVDAGVVDGGAFDGGRDCESKRSVREPALYMDLDGSGVPRDTLLLYARERTDERDVFDIVRVRVSDLGPDDPAGSSVFVLGAGEGLAAGCASVRDPAVVPAFTHPATRASGELASWLFFTCERRDGPSEIRAVGLSGGGSVVGGASTVVLDAGIGAYARGGVRGAEVIAVHAEDRHAYRLWFSAIDAAGVTTLALAEGQGREGELPSFAPFAGNPVLRADSTFLSTPGCTTGCALRGLAVARDPRPGLSPPRVSMLIARSVDEGARTRHEYVRIEQCLEPFWNP